MDVYASATEERHRNALVPQAALIHEQGDDVAAPQRLEANR